MSSLRAYDLDAPVGSAHAGASQKVLHVRWGSGVPGQCIGGLNVGGKRVRC